MFKTKYRIVTDKFEGYEAQFRPWWFPFWLECYGVNTRSTIEESEVLIERHNNAFNVKSKVVKHYNPSN